MPTRRSRRTRGENRGAKIGDRPSTVEPRPLDFAPIDTGDEALLRTLLQGLPHAVRIYDAQCRGLMANDLGRSAPHLRPFQAEGHEGFVPLTAEQWEHWPVARAVRTGRPETMNYILEPEDHRTVFLQVLALPVPGPDGRPRLVIEITRDETESTLQTAKLKRLEILLAEMVAQLSEAVAASDSLGDLPRRFDIDVALRRCPNIGACPLMVAPNTPREVPQGSHSFELCAYCQIRELSYPDELHHLTNSIDGLLTTLHQKHQQLMETQREVIHAERLAAVGELVSGIAHEINNPIGIILSRLDAIELEAEATPMPPQLAKDLAVIRTHAERITRTVEGLLAFTRKVPERRRVALDLNGVLRESLELVGDTLASRAVRVETDLCAEPLPLVGDPAALEQVFVNLFVNAADAMQGGGQLTVRSRLAPDDPGVAEATVSDTGEGIPAHLLERIFDPFFSTKQSRGGTGLGLSVSRRIVHEHGGKIRADSTPGQGSVFEVRLPLRRGEAAP